MVNITEIRLLGHPHHSHSKSDKNWSIRASGKVVEVNREGLAKIDFGDFKAEAKLSSPPSLGQAISAKIVRQDGKIQLRSLSFIPPSTGLNKGSASSNSLSTHSIRQLSTFIRTTFQKHISVPGHDWKQNAAISLLVNPLNFQDNIEEISRKLMKWIEGFGFFFHKKMGKRLIQLLKEGKKFSPSMYKEDAQIQTIVQSDFKTQLSLLDQLMKNQDKTAIPITANEKESVIANLHKWIGLMEDVQTGSHEAICIPLSVPEMFQDARLKISPSTKSREQKGVHASLLLVMDRLGEIRADLLLNTNRLHATLFVKDARVQSEVESALPELQSPLNSLFGQVMLKTVISGQIIQEFEKTLNRTGQSGQIDVRI